MKRLCFLIVLLTQAVMAQEAPPEKPCIAFSPESASPTNAFAKEPLESAVRMSGDFEFYASHHEGCWNVHVLSLPVTSAKGKPMGYVVSHTVTDPQSIEVGHALTFGPDQGIFLQAMNKAVADAIRNIRHARSISRLPSQNRRRGAAQRWEPLGL
jgi:hypothetical protein